MKAIQESYFIAKYLNGGGELGARCETLEAMREAIDKANEHNKVYGYQQHQHIICKVQWGRIYDDDALFVSSHSIETRIEIYPEALSE